MVTFGLTVEHQFNAMQERVFDTILGALTAVATASQPGDVTEVITLAGQP